MENYYNRVNYVTSFSYVEALASSTLEYGYIWREGFLIH
jgi:hypothetical protein